MWKLRTFLWKIFFPLNKKLVSSPEHWSHQLSIKLRSKSHNSVYSIFRRVISDDIWQIIENIALDIFYCFTILIFLFSVKSVSFPEQVIFLSIGVFRVLIFTVMVWKYLFASIQHTEVWFSHKIIMDGQYLTLKLC